MGLVGRRSVPACRPRRGGGGLLAFVAACVLAAVAVALAAPVARAAPRDPGRARIEKARQDARARAAEVGRLDAVLATQNGQLARLADAAEIAVEGYDRARTDLETAAVRESRTRQAAEAARAGVARAREEVRRTARLDYVQGDALHSVTALLAPGGPTDLLQRLDYLSLVSRRRLDAVGRMVRARVARVNADTAARDAVSARRAAAVAARRARAAAEYRLVRSRRESQRVQARISATTRALAREQATLKALLAQHGEYVAWRKRVDRQRRLAAAAAAAAAHRPGGVAAGVRPDPNGDLGPVAGGGWTPAKGRAVADAALRWVGTPYAWAGGDASGPTYGIYPDAGVRGFDCSGLALWAWAQVGVRLPHYSGYQYGSGGHVDRADLRPGDLLFWSSDGTAGGIHHVAIYVGDGRVVQAPQSGDVVRVSDVWLDGYLGATRPGT